MLGVASRMAQYCIGKGQAVSPALAGTFLHLLTWLMELCEAELRASGSPQGALQPGLALCFPVLLPGLARMKSAMSRQAGAGSFAWQTTVGARVVLGPAECRTRTTRPLGPSVASKEQEQQRSTPTPVLEARKGVAEKRWRHRSAWSAGMEHMTRPVKLVGDITMACIERGSLRYVPLEPADIPAVLRGVLPALDPPDALLHVSAAMWAAPQVRCDLSRAGRNRSLCSLADIRRLL